MRASGLPLVLLIALVSACNYPRSEPLGDDTPIDADPTAIDADPAAIDADPTAIDAPMANGAVDLGTAGNYVILAKSGIAGGSASVNGDLGISPAADTFISGFSLKTDASNQFAISSQVTGRVYAANYASPTPANLTQAVSDMEAAATAAAARAPGPGLTEVGGGDIGGTTLSPGVYRWSSGVTIGAGVTLAGDASAVWIFQIDQGLTMSNGTGIVLTGGALPRNVFWRVGGAVTIGSNAHLEGVVLASVSVTLQTGATLTGRLLSQTGVTVSGSTVVPPAQ